MGFPLNLLVNSSSSSILIDSSVNLGLRGVLFFSVSGQIWMILFRNLCFEFRRSLLLSLRIFWPHRLLILRQDRNGFGI